MVCVAYSLWVDKTRQEWPPVDEGFSAVSVLIVDIVWVVLVGAGGVFMANTGGSDDDLKSQNAEAVVVARVGQARIEWGREYAV